MPIARRSRTKRWAPQLAGSCDALAGRLAATPEEVPGRCRTGRASRTPRRVPAARGEQSATCSWQAGAACDVTPRNTNPGATGFACYLSNRRHIGETCGLVEGTCHFGLTCANYRCARFCCQDGDCGTTARCDPAWMEWKLGGPSDLGICVRE